MSQVKVTLKGRTPLLLNPMTAAVTMDLHGPQKPRDPSRSPKDEAKDKLIERDGVLGLPVDYMYGCLVNAGRKVPLRGKEKVSTLTSTQLYSFLAIEADFLPLSNGTPGSEPQWEPDVRSAQTQKGRVRVVRPKFRDWGLEVTVTVDDHVAHLETVKQLFEKAGYVGLGSFTPLHRGPFGQFTVTGWEVLEAPSAEPSAMSEEESEEEPATA